MIQKQSGMTLIEVLLGVTILSVIGVVIWNVLIGGISYSNKIIAVIHLSDLREELSHRYEND